MSVKLTVLATVLCFPTLWTFAQPSRAQNDEPSSESRGTVPTSSVLRVKVDGGSIRLEGRSDDHISYVVRSVAGSKAVDPTAPLYKVASYVRGDTSWLVASPRNHATPPRSLELLVGVPQRVQFVQVETSGGDVTVQGVNGRVEVLTGGGQLRIDDVGGIVSAETGGQDINVGSVRSEGHFRTDGGNISIRHIRGNVDAFTGGGSILLGTGMRNAALQSGA